jgi:hypothetical protein
MLPPKVTDGALGLLRKRVGRLVRLLNLFSQSRGEGRKPPLNILAMECRLVGDVAWLLAPESMVDMLATKHNLAARRAFRVCMWDGECNADATTDDGLCAAHAEEQAREEAETDADFDAHVRALAQEEGAG